MLSTKLAPLSVLVLVLQACGSGGSSPTPVSSQIINPGPHHETYLLTASMNEPGDVSFPGVASADHNVTVTVPDTMQINLNSTDQGRATLVLGGVQAYYKWHQDNLGIVYKFFDCTGCVSGQQIQLAQGAPITLTLQSGYLCQNTQIQAVVNGVY